MVCPKCGATIQAGATACPKCGVKFAPAKRCPHCQALIPATANVCPKCGKVIAAVTENTPYPFQNTKTSKPKKPVYKQWWFWLIIALFVFSVAANLINPPDKEKKDIPSTSSRTESDTKNSSLISSNAESSEENSINGFTIKFGTLLDANPNGGMDGTTLVLKVKISSQLSDKLTIRQNYHNVEDVILNQGGDKFSCIDYWAVADMSNGQEEKVIAFTVDSETIQAVKEGRIVAIEFEDYVHDLFIHQSLKNDISNSSASDSSLASTASLIESVLKESWHDNVTVSYDATTITANVWSEGVAKDALAIQASGGNAENETWVSVKNSLTDSLSNGAIELMETTGHSDAHFVLNLLNDENLDNTLLTIMDGIVIYDALAK